VVEKEIYFFMAKTNKDRRDKDFSWGEKAEKGERTDKKAKKNNGIKGGGSYSDYVRDEDLDE
jgi:hypothetical protein